LSAKPVSHEPTCRAIRSPRRHALASTLER
jgi:hypothetical protein